MTKVHVHHGFDLTTPGKIATNKALIDARPLHGVTVNLPSLSDQTFSSGAAITQAQYAAALASMPVMTNCVHNFVIVRTMHPVNWQDNAGWTTIASNLRNLAAAAKSKGQFDGIFLDVEFYGSGTYPWNYPGSLGLATLHDAAIVVQGRGKQITEAIGSVWAEAQVLTTYGPWVGTPKTVQSGGGGWNFGYNDTSASNELMGAFAGGLAWGVATSGAGGHGGRYVDGGEVYQAREPIDFDKCYAWMRNIATAGTGMIPSPTSYPSVVSVGFGVYDRDIEKSGYPVQPASEWQYRLTNALKRADRYVWSYSEQYDWLNTGWPATKVPADIITATKNALAAGAA